MIIDMSPWIPAVLIELSLVGFLAAAWYRYRAQRLQEGFRSRLEEMKEAAEEAKAEARRIEQEALRKRKIVTFEEADLEHLIAAGEMVGDTETIESLKTRIAESAEVMSQMSEASTEIGGRLSEVMEKQMEAVNMVGRLGGTGGLPPEVKEKAEAILDVFRNMDELLSVAYEEMDKLESGLGEVASVITDFRAADPKVRLPSVEALNAALKKKSGAGVSGGDVSPTEPPLDAFDASDSARI